ncbi:hypothetical protein Q4Q39_20195 [Flavivirga amylovorans]|uniref:Uncharacterized protein n=1 Tax=Flavivirga amylovorans TaxID=870486 RepID=A0ABT8X718_9FLAO|nr:hypothetical protein [Flavivirga amylovorans]MDO5989732.1 hypothetical protein [Flavivirga amylovorans]
MVKICIIPKNKSQKDEIIEFLLRGKYLLTVLSMENCVLTKIGTKNRTVRLKKIVISGIIRHLQFNNLNDRLREMYRSNMPILYSIPIIQMDPQQSDAIANYITVF